MQMQKFSGPVLMLGLLAGVLSAADFGDIRNLEDSHTNSHLTTHVYRSLPEWTARRAKLQNQILVAAGLWPMPAKTPLKARRFDRHQYGNYSIEKVVLQTFPGFYVAGNLYLPSKRSNRIPGVLVAHGHWKNGRIHDAEDYSVPALCVNLAAQGYAVFAWDMVGYNDTRQLKHDFGESLEEQLWSFNPLGIQLWDSIRAVDFLQELPEVDSRRIAMTGASGGGTQTFLAAGVDERIRAAAPVDMVSGYFQGDDACEMAPGLRLRTNNVEFAALMAPRPLLMVSSTKDWTKNTPREEFPEVRAIYKLYSRDNRVSNKHVDAPHNYNRESREAVYAFLQRVFFPRALWTFAPKETEVFTGKLTDLLVGDEMHPGQDLGQHKELLATWRAVSRQQTDALNADAARSLLRDITHVELPAQVDMLSLGDRCLLERPGYGDRVPAQWIPGTGDTDAVVVHSHGSGSAMNWDKVKELRTNGAGILSLDVYQTGEAGSVRAPVRGDHLLFHPSDDAERVQDILTGLAWLSKPGRKPVELVCDKGAQYWCWTAAAIAGPQAHVTGALPEVPAAEKDLTKIFFIPGLERAGGLAMVQRLAADAPRPNGTVGVSQ
jgi:dienelactone hydrolase